MLQPLPYLHTHTTTPLQPCHTPCERLSRESAQATCSGPRCAHGPPSSPQSSLTTVAGEQVERYTLTKASNLVLNVDGCIAALFLDLMASCAAFSPEEMQEIVDIGYLNGLFI